MDGRVWSIMLSTNAEHYTPLGLSFTALDATDSGSTVAVVTDDGELFLIDYLQRIAIKRFGHGLMGCVSFENETNLLVCAPDGRVMRLSVTSQLFERTTE
jgi:hypothetical protein